MSVPLISAIVVNYEGGELLSACLRSLSEQDVSFECIVVDNGSRDGSTANADALLPNVLVLTPDRNLGYAGGANLGARAAKGELLVFLNPDVRLERGCLRALAEELEHEGVGACGPVVRLGISRVTEYGSTIDPLGTPVGLKSPSALPLFVSGGALATRAALFRQLGGFDERFFMFVEDADFCWRVLRAGRDVTVARNAVTFHVGGASAPGGYPVRGGWTTTTFRLALRERNTLAMLLKCSPTLLLPIVIPLYVLQSLVTALAALAQGHRSTGRWIMRGLSWNVRHLWTTLSLRGNSKASPGSSRVVVSRMYLGLAKVNALARFGMPRIDPPREVEPPA